jgi:ABC-type antimicrobial peptide transport system permease subunit
MSAFLAAMLLVLRRSLANWKLLSSIVIGVLVAVMLISSTPLFSNALSDLGLQHAIAQHEIETLDIHMYSPFSSTSPIEYQQMWSFLDGQVDSYVGQLIYQRERSIQSYTFSVAYPGKLIDTSSSKLVGRFQVYTNLDKHVRLLEGRMPDTAGHVITAQELQQSQTQPSGINPQDLDLTDYEIEAVVGAETAALAGIKTGDRLIYFSDYMGIGPAQVMVRISGIVEPLDMTEEYWFLNKEVFTQYSEYGIVIPVFVQEKTFFEVLATIFPNNRPTYHWYYYVDTNQVTSLNADSIADSLNVMENTILTKLPHTTYFSNLISVIREFQQKQLHTQIPLFLLVFQIVGIIFYYVATVANMVIEQETTEIALLRSRGANTWQVFGILFAEGALISAIGGIAGPFLGALVFGLLGKTAAFHPLSNGGLLPIRFSSMVFILAAASAGLCLIAFMLPAIQAARRGIVQHRQQLARPPQAPFWQRYYLDIMLLIIGGGLYYELYSRGTLVQQNIFGDLGIDPLLLITPILFMIAVAIIFLRIFPLLVRLTEKIGKVFVGASIVISLRYMARNPVHFGRLILLLMMAAAVGMFSASFLGTLDKSYVERAAYSAGADVRLEKLYDYMAAKGTLMQRFSSVPGVEETSIVYRGWASVGTTFTQVDSTMLAIDPIPMETVTWLRDDFADKSLAELMGDLEKDKPQPQGMKLPDGSSKLGLWVRPAYKQTTEIILYARVEDANNQYWDIKLGTPQTEDWEYIEANLFYPSLDTVLPSPLTLHCLFVSASGGRSGEFQGLYLDSLQVFIGNKGPVVVEDFEDTTQWQPQEDEGASRQLSGGTSQRDSLRSDATTVYSGAKSACYTWIARTGTSYRGIFPNLDQRPLAVIVNQNFLADTGTEIGSWVSIRMPGQYITVEIVDAVNYFPTLDPAKESFMIANLDRLLTLRNRMLGGSFALYPNEAWLSLTNDRELRATAVETLKQPAYKAEKFYYQDEIIATQKSDPLIAAGWGGVLNLAFFGVVLVSGLGFIVYAYLSARGRQLEFAILRTLGFSFRQIITLIGFEQLSIIVIGIGIGTYVGMLLSGVMMPFLQLTERGEQVVPPFKMVTDWATISVTYCILAIAFVVTITLVIFFFNRITISRTLRMGDQ